MASSSSSCSSSRQSKHQVFLSFRGEDTRLNFTSHLLKALKSSGINVFYDEEELKKGGELSDGLLTAIAGSQIAIVILSEDYASSSWCLRELYHIMERSSKGFLVLLPIFYHVDPSDVRKLDGNFKKSFDAHGNKPADQVQRWKNAFAQVGGKSGWHIVGNSTDKYIFLPLFHFISSSKLDG